MRTQMSRLWIRADGNKTLGLGHMMRCMSIADAFTETGGSCEFIVADEESAAIAMERGYKTHVLHSRWNDLSHETEQLAEFLKHYKVELLLVDSYYAEAAYFERLRGLAKVVYLTGKYDKCYAVDALINYTIGSEQLGYEKLYEGAATRLFVGVQYAPLRKQFDVAYSFSEQVKHIFVTTGGTDAGGLPVELLHRAAETEPGVFACSWHIVVGKFYSAETKEQLQSLQEKNTNIHLYENVTDMATLMAGCDMAVSAAGSTIYELCACGVPTIAFSFVDNQEKGRRDFEAAGLVLSAGDVRDGRTECVLRMLEQIKCLKEDNARREAQAKKAKALIDGRGAERLAAALKSL